MGTVLFAVVVVCSVALVLTLLILLVANTIGNYGECLVSINDGGREVKARGGQSLLSTLGEAGIFIPSACGGKGSCGLCVVKIHKGGGDLLPTELPWLSEERRRDNFRLACQVKVRGDLEIELPEEYFSVKQFATEVESLLDLTHDIKQVRLKLLDPPSLDFRAGQFIQFQVPSYELSDEEVYRAYSLSSEPKENQTVEMEIRLVPNGICTTYVHQHLKVGEKITINGPHGDFYLRDTMRDIVFVAGGSGMAPIKSILLDMRRRGVNRKTKYFFGACSKRDLFLLDLMAELERDLPNFQFIPALSRPEPDDMWEGESGLITEVIEKNMDSGDNTEAYLCGSPGMIDACVKVLKAKGVPEELIYYDKFA